MPRVKRRTKRTTKKVAPKLGVEVILIGQQGLGKTTLLTYTPNPHFICDPNERGIQRLIAYGRTIGPNVDEPEIAESFTDMLESVETFAKNPGDRKTLVLEGLHGMELLAKQECVAEDYNGKEEEFESYGTGWKTIESKYMSELRNLLGKITPKGIHIFITAHTDDREKKNTHGADYQIETAVCTRHLWKSWRAWAGGVWFLNKAVVTAKDNPKDKRAIRKVRDANCWMLTNSYDNGFEAKDQYGLPDELDMSGSAKENWKQISEHITGL